MDDVRGGRAAAEHLLTLGYERLVLVRGSLKFQQFVDRRDGFYSVLEEAGFPLSDVAEHEAGSFDEAAKLAHVIKGRGKKRSAVFCATDHLALGVLRGCTELGIDVPDQVALVGYGGILYSETANVALSTVRQSAELMGRTAMELLLQEQNDADGSHEHQAVVFEPELIVRRSSTPTA
jgi:LacI family transcriptional regulator